MAGAVDDVVGSLDATRSLLGSRWKTMSLDFLKVILLSGLISVAAQAAVQASVFLPTDGALAIIASLIVIAVMIVSEFIEGAVNSVSYNIVEGAVAGKRTSILQRAKENFLIVAKVTVIVLAAYLILALPLAIGIILGEENAMCILSVASVLLILGFLFFSQFYMLEAVIAKAGHIGSIKNSFSKVRSRIGGVILFDIALLIIMALLALIIVGIVFAGILVMGATGMGAGLAGWLIFGVALAAMVVLILLVSTAMSMVSASFTYFYWKRISGRA